MLQTFINLFARHRLRLILRHITRKGHSLFVKIAGANLAFAMIASSILPGNVNLFDFEEVELATPSGYVTTVAESENEVSRPQIPALDLRLTQNYRLFHPAVDLAAPIGTKIRPILPGIITHTQNSRFDYGNAIIVDHGNGITSLYAHLSKINVKIGEKVDENTIIGAIGSTGRSTGPHLHLEVRNNEKPVNPSSFITEIKGMKLTAIRH